MSQLEKAIRQKRFTIKPEESLSFRVESETSSQYDFKIRNCSIYGLGAYYSGPPLEDLGMEINCLIPTSKITSDQSEYALGRLVVRSITKLEEGGTLYGFSTVDSKIPLDGIMSKYFSESLNQTKDLYGYELSPEKFSPASFIQSVHRNVDIFSKTRQFKIFNEQWKISNKHGYYFERTESKGPRVHLNRVRKGNRSDYILMGSNDYLGLASHPEVIQAAKDAIDDYGFGSTGSPLTTGVSSVHERLREKLAYMFKKESCILYNSGYAANLGLIPSLVSEQDLVVADILAHASIQDGMQMSRGTSRFYKHNDPEHLMKILDEKRPDHYGSLVITEGVFSMDGDIPPLDKIQKIASAYNSRILVDEAHSFGVLGQNGLGVCEQFNLMSQVDLIMGTFSKVCGGIGGFVVGDKEVIDWLRFFSRPYMFSVSIPPSTAAAALKALEVFEQHPEMHRTLKKNIKHFVEGLRYLGCQVDSDHQSSVIPINIGDEEVMGVMNQVLLEEGVYVVPIIYPAVSKNNCRFRFTVMASHSIADLDFTINVLEKAAMKAGFDLSQSVSKKPVRNELESLSDVTNSSSNATKIVS